MAKVLTGISGNLISAASAGFAPTNKLDVSAIASAYQVVSATATQLYAGTAYVTSVNDAPLSASRAGNAANASLATSAWYDGTGRLISSLPDSAAVSAIASAYSESAASSKQDELTFGYDDGKISAINGSALAGQGGGGGGGSVVSPSGTIAVTDGTSIEATNSAVGITGGYDSSIASYAPLTRYTYTTSTLLSGVSITGADKLTVQWEPPYEPMGEYIGMYWSAFSGDTDDTLISSFEQYIYDDTNESDITLDTSWTISRIDAYKFDGWNDRLIQTGKALTFSVSLPTGSAVLELAWKPVYGYDTAGQISSVDGSALGGVVSGVSTYSGYVTSVNGSSIMGVPSAHKYYQYSGFNYKGNSATASTTIAPYVLSSFVYTLPAGCNSVYFAGFPNANVSASSKLNNGTVVVNSQTYNNCVTASSEISAVRFIWSGTGNQTYYRTASASAGVYHPAGDVVIPLASVADVLESAVLKTDDRLALAGAAAASSCLAIGSGARAYEASIAVGNAYNTATAESIAVGYNNSAAFYGYAVGAANTASGSAMAHGYANGASGQSFSLGGYNSSQSDSVAIGAYNTAGTTSVAIGSSNTASKASFVQGIQNSGYWNSLAVGSSLVAGSRSLAVGASSTADKTAFAQGRACYASGNSFAQGSFNSATDYSFAQGYGMLAQNAAVAFGTFNKSSDGAGTAGAAFVIGDGTASDASHDLMVVTKDGEITMYSSTADTTGTGIMSSIRALSANAGGVDSATCSAIASAYAESAVSGKADNSALSSYVPYSSLEYNTASAISAINGSALAAGSTYSAGEGIDINDDEISVDYDTNTLDVTGQEVTENVTQQSASGLFLLPSSVAALLSQQTNTQVTVHIPANMLRDVNFDYSEEPSITFRFTLYSTDSTSETNVSLFSTALSWENYDGEYGLIDEQDIVFNLPASVANQWSQSLSSAVAFSICGQRYSRPLTSAPVELFGDLSTDPITFTFVDASATKLAVKNPLPSSTSADEGKCLVVDSNGDPEWGTGGKVYTGTDGVVVDNVNDTVGLEAPVDIVAGPGIVIDNPDGNTLRVSVAQDVETVLWTGSKVDGSFSLSESPSNFEKIEVWFEGVQTNVKDIFTFSGSTGIISAAVPKGDNLKYIYLTTWTVSGTTVTYSYTIIHGVNEGTQYKEVRIVKVKGIHRIANN